MEASDAPALVCAFFNGVVLPDEAHEFQANTALRPPANRGLGLEPRFGAGVAAENIPRWALDILRGRIIIGIDIDNPTYVRFPREKTGSKAYLQNVVDDSDDRLQHPSGAGGRGSIVGTVTDPSGAPVPDALVRAQNQATGQNSEVHTNGTGYYEFPLLPAGRYQISAEQPGFQRASSEQFELNSGTRPRIDLKLMIGSSIESVQVVATVPLVNTSTTELGRVIDGGKIDALPLNGRNFQQLVAGVVNSPSSSVGGRGGIEFNGSPALGNNLLLDGVDMSFGEESGSASDASAGASGGSRINVVSVEAIAEFRATGSAFSAEYGRATGGVLTVTTKSGANEFHGTLFEYFRNDDLDANNFFSNSSRLPKPPLRWNQYGGNLGGPIRKDRLFFFFNYEGAHIKQNVALSGNVPTPLLLSQLPMAMASELKSLPSTFAATSNPLVGIASIDASRRDVENTYLGRVDGMFGQHRTSVRISANRQQVQIPNIRQNNPQVYPTHFENGVFQDGWTVRSNLFNEFRAGFNRIDENRSYLNVTSPAYVAITSVGISDGLSSNIHFTDTTYTVADNFSYIRGSHSFKTGFEIRMVRSSRVQGGIPTVRRRVVSLEGKQGIDERPVIEDRLRRRIRDSAPGPNYRLLVPEHVENQSGTRGEIVAV